MNRKAFTLIELLVVIAIIAILAAILFPVFAQAKKAAKSIASLSNAKQIGLSEKMYINDYDDCYPTLYTTNPAAAGFPGGTTDPGSQDGGCAPDVEWFTAAGGWASLLYPYTKNGDIYRSVGAESPFWLAEDANGNPTPAGWCGTPVMSFVNALEAAAPHGVSFMYRKAFGGAGWFNGSPITDTMAANPAANIVHYEYAAWSTDPNYHIWGVYPVGQLNNLALNVIFMDGHAKKLMGTQIRSLRYDLNGGYTGGSGNGAPNTHATNGLDLDWFLSQPNSAGNVNTESSPAIDSSDIG
jgi:prepilin-type N-terminal cleavage/methylation domain-containing protein